VWNALLVCLRWLLGKNYEKIAQYAGAILWVIRKKGVILNDAGMEQLRRDLS
jgi:hypothetical protein